MSMTEQTTAQVRQEEADAESFAVARDEVLKPDCPVYWRKALTPLKAIDILFADNNDLAQAAKRFYAELCNAAHPERRHQLDLWMDGVEEIAASRLNRMTLPAIPRAFWAWGEFRDECARRLMRGHWGE